MKKPKEIIAWGVFCSDPEQGFLTAHWSFAGAFRQAKEIQDYIHQDQDRRCRHKVKKVVIKIIDK